MKRILFLLGSANISGGTYVILQHASYLEKIGFEVCIALVFMNKEEYLNLKNSQQCWHPAIKELNFISIQEAASERFDLAIFTWWATLFHIEAVHAKSYLYFVQSIESRFYDASESFLAQMVNRSYQFGIPVITEATWIKNFLENTYQTQTALAKNGILKSVYTPNGPALAEKSPHQLRILVEGPLDASYKNIANTVKYCAMANVGEIWLLTSSKIDSYPGVSQVFSCVPITEVPKIYRSCDVLVKLSYVEGMFGPPLEIFHCGGTAIVYEVSGSDEYIIHEFNGLVAKRDDYQAVIDYLQNLNHDRNLLDHLKKGALETARLWIDWDQSSASFLQGIKELTHPLSNEAVQTLKTQVITQFSEKIRTMVTGPIAYEKILTSIPNPFHTGLYSISLDLGPGHSIVKIPFGEYYQSFYIKNIRIKGPPSVQKKPELKLRHTGMIQKNFELHLCRSRSAFMEIVIDIFSSPEDTHPCFLYVEFRPLQIWESTKAQEPIEI